MGRGGATEESCLDDGMTTDPPSVQTMVLTPPLSFKNTEGGPREDLLLLIILLPFEEEGEGEGGEDELLVFWRSCW